MFNGGSVATTAIWSGGEHKRHFGRSVITVMSSENICDIPGDKPQALWELLHYIRSWKKHRI